MPIMADHPIDLRCERAESPLAVDTARPRFAWRMDDSRRGAAQTACQLRVARDEAVLRSAGGAGAGLCWDSGPVPGSACLEVEYAGIPLENWTRYVWTVRVRDERGAWSGWADPALFETTLLEGSPWPVSWIGAPDFTDVAACFRRDFELAVRPDRARLCVATPAWAEISVNGRRVDDRTHDPAWTDPNHRLLYSTFDIGAFLEPGANTLGVMLGNGWYRSSLFNTPHRCLPFSLLVMIWEEGRPRLCVGTNSRGWWASTQGPVRQNDIYNGEQDDARCAMPGWDRPGFRMEPAGGWKPALPLEPPAGRLKAQALEPIRPVEERVPLRSWALDERTRVYDFGVNFSGRLRLVLRGIADAALRLRHAETVDAAGRLQVENLRCAANTDRYVSRGDPREIFEPRFTGHGFRYAEIEGDPALLEGLEVRAVHVRSAVRSIGHFSCSDERLNRIHAIAVRTEANNLHGLPTDCPQRDERLGWLNDMTVRAEEAVHNFGLDRLYEKWIDDIADTQGGVTGAIADTAPAFRFGRAPADPVCASYLLVPWLAYLHYGDRRILTDHYAGFQAWVNYLENLAEEGILSFSSYGDWAPPIGQARAESIGAGALSMATPGALMSTGYWYFQLTVLAKMAAILGDRAGADRFAAKAAAVGAAFNRAFLDPATGRYATGSQACQVFPLYLGLVPDGVRPAVVARLVEALAAADGHLTTGNLCTKYLPEVLAADGRIDLALSLLRQETYPSWGYMLAQGATTVWERWEHVVAGPQCGMASHNHPMYGAVDAFFYNTLAGIRPMEAGPGFEEFRLRPALESGLEKVFVRLETPRGRLETGWEIDSEKRITLPVQVPWNAVAWLEVPAGRVARAGEIRESGRVIWRAGVFVPGADGVEAGGAEGDLIRFRIRSGSYRFQMG